ncbi:MAG: phage gp6-like head-tail connector protein [Selenomonadaceae bacterium]|nr:phage gp6-like head-tail connector protein [Selenomonadaceae bacterium]
MITLDEAKEYLRVDTDAEDVTIQSLLNAAINLCCDVARLDREEFFAAGDVAKTAVLYTLGTLYQNREDLDGHALTLRLRSLLFGVRKQGF